MNNETPAQLVTHLSHPNGWWRDTAQQLLVLKQDKSVVPALQPIATTSPNLLARFHAMWTLEGLGALKPALVRQLMEDPEPRMRIQAIRASETLYKAGDRSFANDYAAHDEGPERRRRDSGDADDQPLEGAGRSGHDKDGDGEQSGARRAGRGDDDARILRPDAADAGAAACTPEQQALIDRGGQIYNELCFACHGTDGDGHTEAGARDDDGAAARGIAAGQRPPRLHHQGRAARSDRSRRRQDLHGHDDSDGQSTTTSGLPRWARSCATTSATAAGSSRRPMSRACAPRPTAAQRSGRFPSWRRRCPRRSSRTAGS